MLIWFCSCLVKGINVESGSRRIAIPYPREKLLSQYRISGGNVAEKKEPCVNKSLNTLGIVTFLQVIAAATVAFTPTSQITTLLGPDRATPLLSKISSSSSFVQIMFAPVIGKGMDQIGRKPVMMMSVGVVLLVNLSVVVNPSLFRICASKFLGVLFREFFIISAQAMLSDLVLTSTNKGSDDITASLGAAMGRQVIFVSSAFFIGCIIAGKLSAYRIEVAYIASLGLGLLTMLAIIFLMKETMPENASFISADPLKSNNYKLILSNILKAPLSCLRLLFNYGLNVRILSILLLMQSFPQNAGDFFQILCETVWNISTKDFTFFIALFGVLSIVANTLGSILIQKMGLRSFTTLAILSSACSPIGAILFGFQGVLGGSIVGILGAAQSLGVGALLVSEGVKNGASIGKLAGERSGLMAILKVVGPIFYGLLFTEGKKLFGMTYLPFFFNVGLTFVAMITCYFFLPSS